jgi:trans-aconitate methyltransferase
VAQLFDHHAASYEADLAHALAPSGEDREFFARGRVEWLGRCLRRLGVAPRTVLDFGCGDGMTTPLLRDELAAATAVGIDVSEKSLDIAREKRGRADVAFQTLDTFVADANADLAYCNGVFHHIPPGERDAAAALVARALRYGGLFSLWENNPWSPATHYVMSRCAFDEDVQMLTPRETRALLRHNGFDIVRTDYRFIFPRSLAVLRGIENVVYRVPLGTQYQVLARRR